MFKARRTALAIGLSLAAAMSILPATPAAQAQDAGQMVAGSLGGPELVTAETWARDGVTPIVVFGARLDESCTAPDILGARMNRAAVFAMLHPTNPIIATGGFTRAGCPSEAQAIERGLRFRGVRNPIIKEESSHSTWENAVNVTRINGSPRFVVVSNNFHEARAKEAIISQGRQAAALNFLNN